MVRACVRAFSYPHVRLSVDDSLRRDFQIKTTGLAGGLHWPCKGLIPAALTGPEVTPPATPSLAAPKGAL